LGDTTHYSYNDAALPTQIRHQQHSIVQEYDTTDRCTKRQLANGIEEHFSYDAIGYLLESSTTLPSVKKIDYSYDANNYILSQNQKYYMLMMTEVDSSKQMRNTMPMMMQTIS